MPLFRFRDSLSGASKFLRRGCFEPRRPLEKVEKRQRREAAARLLELDPDFTISAPIIRGGQSNTKLLTDGLYRADHPNGPMIAALATIRQHHRSRPRPG